MSQTPCPYYFVLPKKTARDPKVGQVCYCEHKHSPLRRSEALSDPQPPLDCGGDVSRCRVPLRWQLDT